MALDRYAHHDCDLAMSGNERGCCKSEKECLGEHVCGVGFGLKIDELRFEFVKIVSGYESIVSGSRSEIRKRRLFGSEDC